MHSVTKTVEFKHGHRVRSDGRTIINNVRKFFDKWKRKSEPIKVGDVVQITAEASGLSKSTVKRICSEGVVTGGSFGSPAKCYGTSRKKVVTDDFDRAAIRRTVHEFYTRKEYPTVQMLLKAVHQKGIFLGEKTSLKHLLKEMGFKFKNHDNRKYVMEQPRVIAQRHNFLRKIRKYRREGRPIIYLDETWLNTHHSLTKCWIDNDGKGGLNSEIRKRWQGNHPTCRLGTWLDPRSMPGVPRKNKNW